MSERIRVLLLASLALASGTKAQGWSSQLFPNIDGKFTMQTVVFGGRQWTLDDFSYAGYRLGDQSIGGDPCRRVIQITGKGDISAELQNAIDSAGKQGGGIVAIPKGRYTMSSAVSIPWDNISIIGAGSGETLIQVPANYQSHETENMAEGLFTFGRRLNTSNRGWVDRGPVVARVSTIVQRGALAVDTEDASGVDIGAWVVLQQYFSQALVDANSHSPDQWMANSTFDHSIFSFSYLRRVVAKNANRVSFDAPIPRQLNPDDNPIQIRLTDGSMHENSGIAGITIGFENNIDPRTGRPHGTAVYFEGIRDGWV
jgi:hypothetical protein